MFILLSFSGGVKNTDLTKKRLNKVVFSSHIAVHGGVTLIKNVVFGWGLNVVFGGGLNVVFGWGLNVIPLFKYCRKMAIIMYYTPPQKKQTNS